MNLSMCVRYRASLGKTSAQSVSKKTVILMEKEEPFKVPKQVKNAISHCFH